MMLDNDAQAIFLLTYKHSNSDLKPLSAQEYSMIAYKIREKGFSGPKDLVSLTESEIENLLEINEFLAKRIKSLLELGGIASLFLERLLNQGIQIVTRTDQDYPASFKTLLREYAPPFLSYVGKIELLHDITESCIVSAIDLPFLNEGLHKTKCEDLICIVDSLYHIRFIDKGIQSWGKTIIFSSIKLNKLIQLPIVREKISRGSALIMSTNTETGKAPNYHGLFLYLMALSYLDEADFLYTAKNARITKILDRILSSKNVQDRFKINDLQTDGDDILSIKLTKSVDNETNHRFDSEAAPAAATVYSIGHSNHDVEKFIQLLEQHEIDMLIDIRSSPISKYASQYDQKPLRKSLQDALIGYKYMGKSLGGRPKETDVLNSEGKIIRENIEKKDWYKQGIAELIEMSKKHKRIGFMCSEEDPSHCHRGYVVSNTLIEMGIKVLHIRANGEAQELGLFNSSTDQMEIPL